jgi:hypothetical protein
MSTVDLYSDALEELSHGDVMLALRAISAESRRIDFKQQCDKKTARSVACDVAAFANAYGGLIVLGFKDPDKSGGELIAAEFPLDVSDDAIMTLGNIINSTISPPVKLQIQRYPALLSDASTPPFIVIRVEQSLVSPHEFLPDRRLPVRRERRTDNLSLLEIEALIARRDQRPGPSLEWDGDLVGANILAGQLVIDTYGNHLGVSVVPIQQDFADLEHGREDDDFVQYRLQFVQSRGEFGRRPEQNGIIVGEGDPGFGADLRSCPFCIEIQGTGHISARVSIGWRNDFDHDVQDLANLLAIVFDLSARYYRRKGFGPRAKLSIQVSNTEMSARLIASLPQVLTLSKVIDLSLPFDAALARFVERIWRTAGSNPKLDAIAGLLTNTWNKTFEPLITLRPWYDQAPFPNAGCDNLSEQPPSNSPLVLAQPPTSIPAQTPRLDSVIEGIRPSNFPV